MSVATLSRKKLWGAAIGVCSLFYFKHLDDKQMEITYTPSASNDLIMSRIAKVVHSYSPTIYFPFNHLRMVFSYTVVPNVDHLQRQIINLPDGEQISLDWLPKDYASMTQTTPIVVLVPGLTSDSSAKYTNVFLEYAAAHGYRACVFNRRGYGNMGYKKNDIDPITWNKFDDLDQVLDTLVKEFPQANLYLAGTSMGANYIQKYAGVKGKKGEKVKVKALGCISSPYCIVKASQHILTSRIVSRAMAGCLIATFEPHLKDQRFIDTLIQKNIDPQKVLNSQTSDEFNSNFSIHFTDHKDVESYKKSVSSIGHIKHINVPTLAVNSKNDLIAPYEAIPFEEIAANPQFIQILVRGGGHLEYFSSYNQRRWSFDVVLEFFNTFEKPSPTN